MLKDLDLAGLWIPFCIAALVLAILRVMERVGERRTQQRTQAVLERAAALGLGPETRSRTGSPKDGI